MGIDPDIKLFKIENGIERVEIYERPAFNEEAITKGWGTLGRRRDQKGGKTSKLKEKQKNGMNCQY